ncbi:MAG: T9SS type A sorting domain-containing protein [Muribaculaceae bacterium]|nr:T9SS type A sorting domain-containing protein [Muribaculaceae bacterium]
MKRLSFFLTLLICGVIYGNAANYLIDSRATNTGKRIYHNEIEYIVGQTAFANFSSFLTSNIEGNSTVYVASGTYDEDITITTNGLTFLGNNAFTDWTTERKEESIITGTIYINASNVTINGFKFTQNGRIESTSGTNAKPLSEIKVLYNYFTGMTVKRSTSTPLVEIGNIVANANVNSTSSQCRYKDCEASHNYFEGDNTHYSNCISFGGAFGTTNAVDNYFYDGGTAIYFANAQGTLNIKHNVFKNVGKTTYTAPDGGNKGDFCIALYRSAFANSTTANIVANEFDGCYGQGSAFPLIRVFHGSSDNIVSPQNYRINVNENTFKNKPSVYPNANHELAGQNFLLYNDPDTGKDVRFNLSNNHFDNRFYMFAWVTLDDHQGIKKIYADQFSRFYQACITSNKMSSWTSSLTGTDVGNHVLSLALDDVTVLQSFDIDPLTGDLYFIQMMPTARNNAYNSLHGLPSNHDGMVITRVPCTSKKGYNYTYNTNVESMEIGYGGHGTNICTVRDKNGELWIWGGGNASVNDNNDKSATTARFKFQKNTDLNLNVSSDTEKIKIFNELGAGNEYPACDETSRLLCIYTTTTDVHTYSIYDLDDALEGKKTLLKKVNLNVGDYARPAITNDKGYATWYIQGFDINGDHLYIYEGTPKDTEGNIKAGEPTILLTCYNWRTNTYVYRSMIYDARINSALYGEPEGIVIRPDEYGHACLYFAIVNGNAGSRKVNIYKHIIDYHPGYNATTQSATHIGNSTETSAHFKGDYPAMNYSCDTKSINLETSTVGVADSKTITIDNGEYIFGEWYGVITGEDGNVFNVTINPNNAFSETATATVSFGINSDNATKNSFNAYLRLFSPLASSSVESNDIVIPLTGTYTGETTSVENNITNELTIKVENKIVSIENVDVNTIKAYSTTGALMAQISNNNSLDLSNLNGIYIIEVTTTDSTIYTSKVIIK